MTSGLETEWGYSGRKGRDGQKKKIGKANERRGKVKGRKDEEVNGQGGRGVPQPHTGGLDGHDADAGNDMGCWPPIKLPQPLPSSSSSASVGKM